MFRTTCFVALLLAFAAGLGFAQNFVVPTTTLAAQTANNTSAANSFVTQTNGNLGAGNVSKVDIHSLLYPGATTNIYAHLMVWFGGSNHMNVGYNSTDPAQVHSQITDMISRGINGVIIDWYGPGSFTDQATLQVMAEAETHPGFTFAIMIDQGAIEWDSCSGCSPQQALISQMQYIEQTYFPSPAYMTQQGKPVVTNFDIDLSYTIDWNAVNGALSTPPVFLFQNNSGFTHVLSQGSYSWVQPLAGNYGMTYLSSFYDTGLPLTTEETVGASYKGFNDTLASWGSGRIMGQQCGQTWLQTFSEINGMYNSAKPLPALQLVTWNDYEEATEIESGISNCLTLSASVTQNVLNWTVNGSTTNIDHYVPYISTDGQNLMALDTLSAAADSLNLCSYSIPNGNYTLYLQAVGKPTIANQISSPLNFASSCGASTTGGTGGTGGGGGGTTGSGGGTATLNFSTNPSTLSMTAGGSGSITVIAAPQSGTFNNAIALSCAGLPKSLACAFSPASITPNASPVNSTLTISAAPVVAMDNHPHRSQPMASGWLLGFGIVGLAFIGKGQRQRLLTVLFASVLAATVIGSTACSGISTAAPSAATVVAANPVTYAVSVNGSSGTVQLSTTVTVTVQ